LGEDYCRPIFFELECGFDFTFPRLARFSGVDVDPSWDGAFAIGCLYDLDYAFSFEIAVELVLQECPPVERGGVTVDDNEFWICREDFECFCRLGGGFVAAGKE